MSSLSNLGDALAVPGVSLVPQLEGLINAGRGSGGNGGPEDPLLGGQVNLDRGVAPRVVDLAKNRYLYTKKTNNS